MKTVGSKKDKKQKKISEKIKKSEIQRITDKKRKRESNFVRIYKRRNIEEKDDCLKNGKVQLKAEPPVSISWEAKTNERSVQE